MRFGISEERHDTTDDKVLSSGGKEEEKERITTAAAEEGRRSGVEVEVAQIGRSRKGKRSPYVPSEYEHLLR